MGVGEVLYLGEEGKEPKDSHGGFRVLVGDHEKHTSVWTEIY